MFQQRQQVILINTGKIEKGKNVQYSIIDAAEVISTTLGPKAMLKMILDQMGGVHITRSGVTILREITTSHQASKSLIEVEVSRTQQEEVGDGNDEELKC
jgi:T-complex protein 1 subunit gamma